MGRGEDSLQLYSGPMINDCEKRACCLERHQSIGNVQHLDNVSLFIRDAKPIDTFAPLWFVACR